MMIKDSGLLMDDWNIEIIATDLSQEALSYARSGAYSQLEVQRGLPVRCLVQHFTQDGPEWRVKPEVRALVQFEQGNLVTKAEAGSFDIIFCRHVLENFDKPTQMKVLQALRAHLRRDGTLVLGRGEEAMGVFKPMDEALGIYAPNDLA
jgi:chemotaxis protein methyltransferase CheR